MEKFTNQMEEWAGQFGHGYTDRNALSLAELDQLYRRNFGISRTELNADFVSGLDRSIKVLEVGSNIGNQLVLLQNMGFKSLYGIELQSYAVEMSKHNTKNINIIEGSAFDIPFKDKYFDLVFTSGLLIHIAPDDILKVLDEISRCSRRYIWGMEFYAEVCAQVNYRGHDNLLWTANFPKLYLDRLDNLKLVKEKIFKNLSDDNLNVMFLLEGK